MTAANTASNRPEFAAKAAPVDIRATLPARENVFVMLFPKGGRTLSLPKGADGKPMTDDAIWAMAGFKKGRQITDTLYTLVDETRELSGSPVEIWVNERKPKDIMRLMSVPDNDGVPQGNMGIVGSDVRDEFMNILGTSEARQQGARVSVDELVNLDVSRGGIAVLLPDWMNIQSLRELDGMDIVTKYPKLAEKFRKQIERKYGITMGQIRPRDGGTEDDILLDRNLNVIIDFVQSGKSAANRNLRVPFMSDAEWEAIRTGKSRFDDIDPKTMEKMPAVLQTSTGLLVRPNVQFTTEQERIGDVIQRRITQAIEKMKRAPATAPYKSFEERPLPTPRNRQAVDNSYGPHSAWTHHSI